LLTTSDTAAMLHIVIQLVIQQVQRVGCVLFNTHTTRSVHCPTRSSRLYDLHLVYIAFVFLFVRTNKNNLSSEIFEVIILDETFSSSWWCMFTINNLLTHKKNYSSELLSPVKGELLSMSLPAYNSSFFSSLAACFAAMRSLMMSALEWFFLIHFQMPLASRGPSYFIGSVEPALM